MRQQASAMHHGSKKLVAISRCVIPNLLLSSVCQ